MQFQTYQKYKPSGIDWLGEIPEGWEVKRLKDLFFQVSIKTSCIPEGSYIPLENIESFTGILLQKVSNENNEETLLFQQNDILFNKLRPYLGKVLLADFDGGISTEAIVMRLIKKNKYQNRFFLYRFLSTNFIFKVNSITTGVKMPRTNPDRVLEISCPIPNKQTQTVIAKYLDQYTALIDKKIALLKAKKQSYTELKQTLINEVVTKGLDTTIEMKDSGIEWIGQIPKHWEVKRLKQIFDERVKKNSLPNGEPVTENILSVMKDVGVINHRDKGLVGNKMSEDITGYKLVHIDDIVVNKMNVMIGSVGISKEFGALSVIYIILKAKSSYLPKFYDYLFRIKRFQKHLRTISTGILEIREAVNMILFMGQEFPVPPKSEQVAIANYLDKKTSKIDQIIKKIYENILALQEFRKTLINDAVTGKVKVL